MSHKVANKQNQLRKKLANNLPLKTICLTMIVKNESKNMVRLLESAIGIIDFVSIVDTGSTDNTPQVIEDWCRMVKIPHKVHHEPFQNFGYNRTHSILMAKQTFPKADYYLLSDADFVWEVNVGNTFNKKLLFAHQYTVVQYSDNLSYSNTRLLSSKVDWVCEGVTHEYWKAKEKNSFKDPVLSAHLNTIRIKDLEDGGCKSDKYERDQRLLEKEYFENKDLDEFVKVRYSFYLAQTYKCLHLVEKSIDMYKERISYGGWFEEIYISMYQIGINYESWKLHLINVVNCLEQKKTGKKVQKYLETWNPNNLSIDEVKVLCVSKIESAIEWYKKAWEYRPSRAEALAKTVVLLRDLHRHQEAYELCKIGKKIPFSKDTLFVEPESYEEWYYDFELSINCFYLGKMEEGAETCIRLLENENLKPHIREGVEKNCAFYN